MELRFPAGAAPLFRLIRCIQLLFVGDGGGSGVGCGEVAAWCFGFLGFDSGGSCSGGRVKILVLRGVSGDLLSVFRLVRCVVLLLALGMDPWCSPRSFFFRAGDFVIGGGFPAALSLLHGSGGASCSSGRPDPVLLEVPLSVLLFSSTATALCLAVLLWWAISLVVRSRLLCFTSAKGWKLPVIPVVGWGFVLLVGFDVLSGAPHLASEVWILSAFRVLGWSLLSSSSFLVFGLMVMRELCAGAHGCLRASRLAKSWGPTADDLFSRMACSFTMLGVRSPVWKVKVCGVVLWCETSRRRRLVLRLKKNSRAFCVISRFLEVLCVTKRV